MCNWENSEAYIVTKPSKKEGYLIEYAYWKCAQNHVKLCGRRLIKAD